MGVSLEDHGLFSCTLRIGAWTVEPQLNKISRDGESVQLEPKVMHVLLCMAERPGRTVTKERFMEEVWADTVVTDDVLSRCISELRKALGDDTKEPHYVETIRKTGYRLIAPVTILNVEEAEPSNMPARRGRNRALGRRDLSGWVPAALNSRWYRWMAAAGFLSLVVGLLLGALLWGQASEVVVEQPPETTPFTSYPGVEADPALSPNGQQVAFVWDGGERRNQSIYVKQSSSETPLRISSAYANDYSPAWSPDGQQIAFARVSGTTHSIHVTSSLGGNERRIARYGGRVIHSLAWSPDTTRQTVAVSVRESTYGPFHIELMDLGVDSTWAVTAPPSTSMGDTEPTFSPDGESLAFLRTQVGGVQDVYVVPADAGNPRRISFEATRITGLTWDSDGGHLLLAAVKNGNAGLWRVPLHGGQARWVMAVSERSDLLRPTLSHAGDRLAYAQASSNTNISVVDRTQGSFEPRPLALSTRWDSHPALAPDSQYVAFVSMRSGHRELWRTRRDGDGTTQLTDLRSMLTASPTWSPDNEQIAFVSGSGEHADIYVVDAEGGPARALTNDNHNNAMPSWSRDGEWVYFASDRGGSWQIWMVSPTTGHIFPVLEASGIAAQESPNGDALYVARPDTAGIWRMALDDRLNVPIVQASIGFIGQEAPDSDGEENLDLVVPWLSPHDYANWRVTENGIYFIRRRTDATVLSYYQFATGNITDLTVVEDLPEEPSFDIAPDGSWFVLSQVDRRESDIMLLNNFQR